MDLPVTTTGYVADKYGGLLAAGTSYGFVTVGNQPLPVAEARKLAALIAGACDAAEAWQAAIAGAQAAHEVAQTAGAEGIYKVEGKDGFDPDADFYPIGEWPTYEEALEAARSSLDELNLSQPDAGGQFGIQDRVYVVHPDGRRQRVFP
jgi:hypothetical protein